MSDEERERLTSEIVTYCMNDLSARRLRQLFGCATALFALDAVDGTYPGDRREQVDGVSIIPADEDQARGLSMVLGETIAANGRPFIVRPRRH